jgi:hypothetical protein
MLEPNIKFHKMKVYDVRKAEMLDVTSKRRNIKHVYVITDKKMWCCFLIPLENNLCLGLFFCDSKIIGNARFYAVAS